MKKVLISLAIAVAPVAFAGTSSGVIHFQGSIVNASCIAEQSASNMELSHCRGTAPTVVLQKGESQNLKVRVGKAYNSDAPDQALNENDYFTISYAAAESLPANADLSYLVSYD